MASAVWNGVVTFGLVTLPVRLVTATQSHTVHFRQIQRGTADRVRNRPVNERTGKEVNAEEIVKGFEAGDAYIVVEPTELEDLVPGRSRALEITSFVDITAVELIYFDRTYYLAPRATEYDDIYALLHQAMRQARRAGIGTLVMHQRQYLVAVTADADGVLAAHTLHWADEIRDPRKELPELPEEKTAPGGRALDMAVQLVESLSADWEPGEHRDYFQERVRALLTAKMVGGTVPRAAPAPAATSAQDLMSVLEASVEKARTKRP
ncbi:non-homologous end joining protein Ku [Streptomyces chartreusis]|uniref:non-homologous end joining protein Ku n=1 Tax=Streptomyces chartreusis TaxID=1969 RepID=UPI003631BC2D